MRIKNLIIYDDSGIIFGLIVERDNAYEEHILANGLNYIVEPFGKLKSR